VDPILTLPVGTWRITAHMSFAIGGCNSNRHELDVSNVIQVVAPTGDGPVVDQVEDSLFRLELTTPRRIYGPLDAIEPVATVTSLGPAAETTIYHAGSIVGWTIEEVGGSRTMSGGMTAVCATSTIRRDTPLTFPFEKSGGIGQTFDRAWFDDPDLHLPVGTWRIRAYTTITADDGPAPSDGSFTCGTRGHGMEATNVITVVGATPPSVQPSPVPTAEASPTASPNPTVAPSPSEGPVIGSVGDGIFRLDLKTPHGIYGPDDAIDPVATLFYIGPESTVTFAHAKPTIGFRIEEVGGDRTMGGVVEDVCQATTLQRGEATTFPFVKGGTVEQTFDRAWFADPILHLPVGTWRILADLDANIDQCGPVGDIHKLTVQTTIVVR
jgi:hypothetical protein